MFCLFVNKCQLIIKTWIDDSHFNKLQNQKINQEILNLGSSKVCQESDFPTKIIKAISDIFTKVIHKESLPKHTTWSSSRIDFGAFII